MTSSSFSSITIRPAYADDAVALARLAALDSAVVPDGPLMVAEVDGEPLVALSTQDSTVIADPFHRTSELVELLRTHLERSGPQAARLEWRWRPGSLLRRRLRVA
jgi:hypothetical protein